MLKTEPQKFWYPCMIIISQFHFSCMFVSQIDWELKKMGWLKRVNEVFIYRSSNAKKFNNCVSLTYLCFSLTPQIYTKSKKLHATHMFDTCIHMFNKTQPNKSWNLQCWIKWLICCTLCLLIYKLWRVDLAVNLLRGWIVRIRLSLLTRRVGMVKDFTWGNTINKGTMIQELGKEIEVWENWLNLLKLKP